MQEWHDVKDLMQRINKLAPSSRACLMDNIVNQVCWHGPVDREWLESEISDYEAIQNRKELVK